MPTYPPKVKVALAAYGLYILQATEASDAMAALALAGGGAGGGGGGLGTSVGGGVGITSGAGGTIAGQAAAKAGISAGGGHGEKQVATAKGANYYQLPIGSLIIPHPAQAPAAKPEAKPAVGPPAAKAGGAAGQTAGKSGTAGEHKAGTEGHAEPGQHFVHGQPSHFIYSTSEEKWLANEWKKEGHGGEPDEQWKADHHSQAALAAGTHKLVQVGDQHYAVHKSAKVWVPKGVDTSDEASVKNSPKVFQFGEPGKEGAKHVSVTAGAEPQPATHTEGAHKVLESYYKEVPPGHAKVPVHDNGKLVGWVPDDWKVYKSAAGQETVHYAQDPQGTWHDFFGPNGGVVGGVTAKWLHDAVGTGDMVPDEQEPPSPSAVIPSEVKTGAQPAKVDIGGVAATKEEIHSAIEILTEKQSTNVKGPLKAAGNPLWQMDYMAVSKKELEDHPELKVSSGSKQKHVGQVKLAVLHYLASKLDDMKQTEAQAAIAEAAQDAAEAAAEQAQELTPATHEWGGVQASKEEMEQASAWLVETMGGHQSFKQAMSKLGNPLANSDYMQAAKDWKAAHPNTAKGLSTKQLMNDSLLDNITQLHKADKETGHDEAAALHELVTTGSVKSGWQNVSTGDGAIAQGLVAAANYGHPVRVYLGSDGAWKVSEGDVPPPGGKASMRVTPEHKVFMVLANGDEHEYDEDHVSDIAKAWIKPKSTPPAESPAGEAGVKESLVEWEKQLLEPPPKVPEPPAESELDKWKKTTWYSQLDTIIKETTASQLPEITAHAGSGVALLLWASGQLEQDRWLVKEGDSWVSVKDKPVPGTYAAPGPTFYHITKDHQVTAYDGNGNSSELPGDIVLALTKQFYKPKEEPKAAVQPSAPAAVQVESAGGIKVAFPAGSKVYQSKVVVTLRYVKTPDGEWYRVYKDGTKEGPLHPALPGAYDKKVQNGDMVPVETTGEPKLEGMAGIKGPVHVEPGSTTWQDTQEPNYGTYVKKADGTWDLYYGDHTKPDEHLGQNTSLDTWVASGTLKPIAVASKAYAVAVMSQKYAPDPAVAEIPAAEPGTATPKDIQVTIAGKKVLTVPAGSKVYWHSAGNAKPDTVGIKYVQYEDGSWYYVNKATPTPVKVSVNYDSYVKSGDFKLEGQAELESEVPAPPKPPEPVSKPGEPDISVVVKNKVVGTVAAGSSVYVYTPNTYTKSYWVKKPDGVWYKAATHGISKEYNQKFVQGLLEKGQLTEVPPPTEAELAQYADIAKYRNLLKTGAVKKADAKSSWQARAVSGLIEKADSDTTVTVTVTASGIYEHGYLSTTKQKHWRIESGSLSGTGIDDEGNTFIIPFAQVKQAIDDYLVPDAVAIHGDVYKYGYYYNPKGKAYLEIKKSPGSGYGYHSEYKYGVAARATYVWHKTNGDTEQVSPTFAEKQLEKNTEFVTEPKVFQVTGKAVNHAKYATPQASGSTYSIWSETGTIVPNNFVVFHDDGSAVWTDKGVQKALSESEASALLAGGTLLDAYGNTVVKPGVTPDKYHIFGGPALDKDMLTTVLHGMEAGYENKWQAPVKENLGYMLAAGSPGQALGKSFFGAQTVASGGMGATQRDSLMGLLRELVAIPEQPAGTDLSGDVEPKFLKGLPPGINVAGDVFKWTDAGYAEPFAGTIVPPGTSLDSYTSPELGDKIKAVSAQYGDGKVVGTHVASMSKDQKVSWLTAWKSGDMVQVFDIDKTTGKVSPVHPGAPDNTATHLITWSPFDPAQVPAIKVIEGQWTNYQAGIIIPKAEVANYLIKVGLQNAVYLSPKERRDFVKAHRSHDQDTVDSLTRDALNRFKSDAKPLSEPLAWTDNVQPAKSYDAYLDEGTSVQSWNKLAVDQYFMDHKAELKPVSSAIAIEKGYSPEPGGSWQYNEASYYRAIIQRYLDEVAAAVEAEKKRPKYELVPGEPGVVQDQFDKRYLWHTGQDAEQRLAVAALARTWGFRTPPVVRAKIESTGVPGVITREIEPAGTLAALPGGITSLTNRELADVAREHVLDYALANPRSTPGDFLRLADGSIVAADKHGAFENLLWAGAHRTGMNDWAKQPVSMVFDAMDDKSIAKSQVDAAYIAAQRAALRMSKLPDERMRPFLKEAGLSKADIEDLLTRKGKLPAHIQALWDMEYKKAGWTPPDVPQAVLTHGLHAGVSEPDFFPHLLSAKSFGVPAFYAGPDLKYGNIHVWTEFNADGQREIRGELTVTGSALESVTGWVNSHADTEAANMVPKGETEFYHRIMNAAEVVNKHAKSQDYTGPITQGVLQELAKAKGELNDRLIGAEAALASGPASPKYATFVHQYGDPGANADMAKYYLAQVQEVEDHKAQAKTFLPTDLPAWKPVEKTGLLAGGVEITYRKATRDLGTSTEDIENAGSQALWQLGKEDGELHLAHGKSTTYAGMVWQVKLPTGEVLEVNDSGKTNTPLSSAGRIRFTSVTADESASLENIRSFLQLAGLPLEEPTMADMENLYWRQMAQELEDHVDSMSEEHKPVWNELAMHVQGKPAGYGQTGTDLLAKLRTLNLPAEQEADIWRQSWAKLTSPEQVQDFVANSGYLPRLGHFDIHNPEVASGRPDWYRFDITPAQLAGKQFLSNQFYNMETDAALVVRTGGLFSSEGRLRALGTYKPGMSWSSDEEKGSSGHVFLRQNRQNQHSHVNAWVSPRVLGRLHNYTYNQDKFGHITLKKDSTYGNYFNVAKFTGHTGEKNETMVLDAIGLLDDIEVIKAYDATQRNQLIADLKNAGITEIRGVPVEDRIVTASGVEKAIETARAAMKALVPDWFAHAETPWEPVKQAVSKWAGKLKDIGGFFKVSADDEGAAGQNAVYQVFYKMAGVDPKKGSHAVRGPIKGAAAARVAGAMKSTDEEIKALYSTAGLYAPENWGPTERVRAVAALIGTWATASDTAPVLALQRRAKDVFGLPEDALMPHTVAKKTMAAAPTANTEAEAQLLEQGYGTVIDDLLTTMWQLTQDDLTNAGIEKVTLYRMMRFPGEMPEWAKLGTVDAPAAYPFSSWSMSKSELLASDLWGYGNSVLVKTTVPKELLLAYPRSGFGAYHQGEWVVLDSAGQWEVVEVS